jgi:hypothetical protein
LVEEPLKPENRMKQKSIISTLTLLTSLMGYFYAKHADKDPVPIVMIGGFFGAMAAEAVVKRFGGGDDRDNPPPPSFS